MLLPTRKSIPSAAERTQRDLFAWSLLAGLLLLAAMAVPFFAGRIYTRDDLGAFHLPVRAFYAQQIARGQPFDWMPQVYSGFYLTGEGQGGTYHPWHLLLYGCLPLRVALGWEWLGTYPLMWGGTWLFLRRRLQRRDAAMFGAVLFTFCGFNLLHFLHPNAVAVVAHIPWLLWALDIVLSDSRRRKVAWAQAAIALLTGSQLLLGYPQYVWFSLLAEACYAAWVIAERKYAPRRGCGECLTCGQCVGCTSSPWARLVIAKGCGLLLGGSQLLPTLEALSLSARRWADAAYAYQGSLHPLNLIQLVAPYLFADRVVGRNTHELGLYVGAVPLMLAIWVLVRRRALGSLAPLATATAIFAAAVLWLALGKYGEVYRLQASLPLVGAFRFPCRYLVLFELAVAVLAAIGFVLLARDYEAAREQLSSPRAGEGEAASGCQPVSPSGRTADRRLHMRQCEPLWVVVAVSAAVAAVGLILQGEPHIASMPLILAGPLLVGTAAVLVALASGGVRAALVGLVLFAAADLGCYGLSYSVYPGTARLEEYAGSVSTSPPGTGGRVLASTLGFNEPGLRTGNQITLAGWDRADGYAGLEPEKHLDYRGLPALQVAGVRWVRRNETTAAIRGLAERNADWLEVPRPLPRVRLVSHVAASGDPARDIGSAAVESDALCDFPLSLPNQAPGTAALVAERPGLLLVDCDCPAPQLLVVSESFHPGWRATVGGSAQSVIRVNGDFMGCLVGPGKVQVRLEFRPDSLRRGWMVSWLGLALVVVCFLGYQIQGRHPPFRSGLEGAQTR